MSIYGDVSNLQIISFILGELKLEHEVLENQNPDSLRSADFFFLGGGQDQDQANILQDLLKIKTIIKEQIYREGAIFLGICGGYQLLGKYYQLGEQRLEGLNFLDFYTESSPENKRLIGNTKATAQETEIDQIFGFENHGGKTFLDQNLRPLAKIKQGAGNNGLDQTEGVFANFGQGLILGSYFHSFLPKNFQIALFIIKRILKNKKIVLSERKLWKLNQTLENFNRSQLSELEY